MGFPACLAYKSWLGAGCSSVVWRAPAGSATAPVDEGGSPFSTPRHEGEPCTQEEPQHSPGSSPPRESGAAPTLAHKNLTPRLFLPVWTAPLSTDHCSAAPPRLACAGRLGPRSLSGLLASSLPHAVVSKASELLPGGTISGRLACLSTSLSTSLSRRRGRSPAPPPPPPPLAVPVRLLGGGEAAQLQLPAEASLTQLQQGAWERAGVPPALQRLCIQGGRHAWRAGWCCVLDLLGEGAGLSELGCRTAVQLACSASLWVVQWQPPFPSSCGCAECSSVSWGC